MGIGTDEKSRLAVQQFGADAETITERHDHDQQERQIDPRFAPKNGTVDFDRNLAELTGGEATDFRYGDGIILANLLRSGRLRAIQARPSGRSRVALRQR